MTFEELTAENDHTGATLVLARMCGGTLADAYIVVLEEIAARHELLGHIETNERVMRDAIQKDLIETARLKGLIA